VAPAISQFTLQALIPEFQFAYTVTVPSPEFGGADLVFDISLEIDPVWVAATVEGRPLIPGTGGSYQVDRSTQTGGSPYGLDFDLVGTLDEVVSIRGRVTIKGPKSTHHEPIEIVLPQGSPVVYELDWVSSAYFHVHSSGYPATLRYARGSEREANGAFQFLGSPQSLYEIELDGAQLKLFLRAFDVLIPADLQLRYGDATAALARERVDRDGDGLPDQWEERFDLDVDDEGSTDPANGAAGDPDGDGFTNEEEYALRYNGFDPRIRNSTGDAFKLLSSGGIELFIDGEDSLQGLVSTDLLKWDAMETLESVQLEDVEVEAQSLMDSVRRYRFTREDGGPLFFRIENAVEVEETSP
jgi:hypothetical protein